jgi:hypothetical protein
VVAHFETKFLCQVALAVLVAAQKITTLVPIAAAQGKWQIEDHQVQAATPLHTMAQTKAGAFLLCCLFC